MAEHGAAHPVQAVFPFPLKDRGAADHSPVVAVIGRTGEPVHVQLLVIGRSDSVEAVEIVGAHIPVGQRSGETDPGNERGRVEHAMKIPGTLAGPGPGNRHMVEEIGIDAAVSIIEYVGESAQFYTLV